MQASSIHKWLEFLRSCAPHPAGGDSVADTALTGSFQTIDVPAGHDLVLIVPRNLQGGSVQDTVTVTLKKDTGDTGIVLSNIYPTCLTLATPGSDIGLLSSAASTCQILFGKTATSQA